MRHAGKKNAVFKKYGIFTVAIDGANVHGCRISPNVFTTTEELDSLVDAVIKLSKYNKFNPDNMVYTSLSFKKAVDRLGANAFSF